MPEVKPRPGTQAPRPGPPAGPRIAEAARRTRHCDTGHDHAVYVEPNVWVEHNLTGS